MKKINNITPFELDISKWYSDLVTQAELVSYGPVKGTMFYKPYGFAIWKNISKILNDKFIENDIEEVNFPLLLPESLLLKEKKHVEGFAPEALTITKVGDKKLNEHLIIRPTSETLFGVYFSENVNSYSQLPVKLNQWVNVVRWENNTRPFLRNSEFFWQEGHTIHETAKEAESFSKQIHKLYEAFVKEHLLLPVISGEKTEIERFAGADKTFTIETILKDGQALQTGTSHFLGDSFTKAFNVKVQGKDNKLFYPSQTSWGTSTRMIGALIMTHSDNKGLILPSSIAPYQIIIIPLFPEKNKKVNEISESIKNELSKKFRVKIDNSNKGFGFKSMDWEVKGVPLRIEIGPNDIEKNKVILSIRNEDKKIEVNINDLNNKFILDTLKKYDKKIYKNASKIIDEKRKEIKSIEEIENVVKEGNYAVAYWNPNPTKEKEIKEKTGATIRCILNSNQKGTCINSNKQTNNLVVFARSY